MNTDSALHTQDLHNANSTDNQCGNTNQPVDTDDTHSIDHCPNSLPSGNVAFTIAFNVLERVARENGFVIHDVPYDGNCLFASTAYE